MRVCRARRVQDEQDEQDERNRQDERGGQDRQNERSAYGPLFYLSFFLDCPFCEHVLRKKKERSLTLARALHPAARDPLATPEKLQYAT